MPAYDAALWAAGEDDAGWVDEQLRASTDDPARADYVVQLVQSAGLTGARAEILLDAVRRGAIEGESLARLLYGASVRSLDRNIALRVIEATAASDTAIGLEHALGMLHQYEEVDSEVLKVADGQELAARIAIAAVSSAEGGDMRRHYAYEVAKKLDPDQALAILEARLRNDRTLPNPPEAELLNRVFADDPEQASKWARHLLEAATAGERERWAVWAENLSLLSHAGAADSQGHAGVVCRAAG